MCMCIYIYIYNMTGREFACPKDPCAHIVYTLAKVYVL